MRRGDRGDFLAGLGKGPAEGLGMFSCALRTVLLVGEPTDVCIELARDRVAMLP